MQVQATITLTDREAKFVTNLALYGLSPTAAATKAGWAISSARDLLRKRHVRKAIHQVHRNSAAAIEHIARLDARYGAPEEAEDAS